MHSTSAASNAQTLAALMLILQAYPLRQIEQRAEVSFQHRIAINLAADVADDPAKPRPQELELAPGALNW